MLLNYIKKNNIIIYIMLLPVYINYKKDENIVTVVEEDIVYNRKLQIFFLISLFFMLVYIIFFLGLDSFNS